MKLFHKKNKITIHKTPVCIYGPPEMLMKRAGRAPDDDYDPENNAAEDIYGPPEMLGAIGGSSEDPTEEEVVSDEET